jgi:RNA polymerase sigma factor (sigma-70 family)
MGDGMVMEDEAHDGALLARARSGDSRALALLMRRHEAALRARIRRLLPARLLRRLAVSDILQETRITAHERMGEFEERGEDSFRHWILAIAERKARREVQRHVGVHMRSLGREVTQGQRLPTGQFVGGWPTASEVAMAEETAEMARRALAELSEDDQTILRLCREEGLAFREAAERMGRSYEATKKLYGRALARFAASLGRRKRGQ